MYTVEVKYVMESEREYAQNVREKKQTMTGL